MNLHLVRLRSLALISCKARDQMLRASSSRLFSFTRLTFNSLGPPTCKELPHRNVQRFRGGLVSKAHRLVNHPTLGLRGTKTKRRMFPRNVSVKSTPIKVFRQSQRCGKINSHQGLDGRRRRAPPRNLPVWDSSGLGGQHFLFFFIKSNR